MPGKTQTQADAVLNVLRATNITAPGTVYVGLFSTVPANDNAAGTEQSAGGYARASVAFGAPATDSGNVRKVSNSGTVTIGPATADWPASVGFGIYDASTAGNLLYWDYLLGPRINVVADASTDALTATSHGLANGNRVQVQNTGGTLPGGLAVSTVYYVVGATTNTFQLSATSGGSAIDITSTGNGLNQVALDYTRTVLLGDSAQFTAGQLSVKED